MRHPEVSGSLVLCHHYTGCGTFQGSCSGYVRGDQIVGWVAAHPTHPDPFSSLPRRTRLGPPCVYPLSCRTKMRPDRSVLLFYSPDFGGAVL